MVKEGFDFWEEGSGVFKTIDHQALDNFHADISEISNEISAAELSDDSHQVSVNIAGYIARQIQKRVDCAECCTNVESKERNTIHNTYLNLLSRGGLKHPSQSLADFVSSAFGILDVSSKVIIRYLEIFKSNMLAMEVKQFQ